MVCGCGCAATINPLLCRRKSRRRNSRLSFGRKGIWMDTLCLGISGDEGHTFEHLISPHVFSSNSSADFSFVYKVWQGRRLKDNVKQTLSLCVVVVHDCALNRTPCLRQAVCTSPRTVRLKSARTRIINMLRVGSHPNTCEHEAPQAMTPEDAEPRASLPGELHARNYSGETQVSAL